MGATLFKFECVNCSARVESDSLDPRCAKCGSALLLQEEGPAPLFMSDLESLPPGVWRYRAALPGVPNDCVVSLGEGGTPLIDGKRLGDEVGLRSLMIKDETRNPTGSFIDRGSTVLASLARVSGIRRISCTTTGNFGASLAAYCAKAAIATEVRIHPRTDHGKLYQMIAYGAKIEIASGEAESEEVHSRAISVTAGNPFVLAGEKTTGFEIVQELGWLQPDAIVLPVGTGGHLTMICRALKQLHGADLIDAPAARLVGVQLRASAPIVGGLQPRRRSGPAEEPLTELEESEPIFKRAAISAIRESKGCGVEVSAREALLATSLLARTEGLFAEPAAASVVAAIGKMRDEKVIDRDERVVCVITGTGLKDTKMIKRMLRTPRRVAVPDAPALRPLQVGSTKLRMMEALSGGQRFGYDLWKSLQGDRGITTASVYQHLSELETATLVRRSRVTTARGRERVYYELTTKGNELLGIIGKTREVGFQVR